MFGTVVWCYQNHISTNTHRYFFTDFAFLPRTQFSQLFTRLVLCDLAIIMHLPEHDSESDFKRNTTGNAEGLQNISFCQTLGDTLMV